MNHYSTCLAHGGLIDPGYGYNKRGGAVLSVQRKAFTEPIKLKAGDPIARGLVYFLPHSVGRMYGHKDRNSHYAHAHRFVPPK